MRRIFIASMLVILCAGCVYAADDHVIINQIFGGEGGYVSHNFIELYNPTSEEVNLAGWAVHYRSAPSDAAHADKWYKLELNGSIPSKCSYLIRCAECKKYTGTDRIITSQDMDFIVSGGVIYCLYITRA